MTHDETSAAVVAERAAAVTRSIASGHNACGTLIGPDGRLNEDFVAASVRPALQVYADEARTLRAEWARASAESEERRRTLEMIYANAVGLLPPDVAGQVCRVLGFAAG